MEIVIKYSNGCSKHIRPSVYFDPHDYRTEGSRRHSNLQSIITDNSFGEISSVLVTDNTKGIVIDRKYKDPDRKYSYYKSPEERKLAKEVINLCSKNWIKLPIEN